MEKLEQIMDKNELCVKALSKENEKLKEKLRLIDKAVYEGYYDEVGDYILTFNKETLQAALEKVFDAKKVEILH